MARSTNTNILGLIAIIIGALLVMGGSMFLLVTSIFMSGLPRIILIPPIVQIALGLLGSLGGFLLNRGYAPAKFILLFVAVAIAANTVALVAIMATTANG